MGINRMAKKQTKIKLVEKPTLVRYERIETEFADDNGNSWEFIACQKEGTVEIRVEGKEDDEDEITCTVSAELSTESGLQSAIDAFQACKDLLFPQGGK
jgi:hypothetical protein